MWTYLQGVAIRPTIRNLWFRLRFSSPQMNTHADIFIDHMPNFRFENRFFLFFQFFEEGVSRR